MNRHTESTCQIRNYVSSYIVRWLTLTLTHFGNTEMSVAQVTYTCKWCQHLRFRLFY